jgi:hypothetical protein
METGKRTLVGSIVALGVIGMVGVGMAGVGMAGVNAAAAQPVPSAQAHTAAIGTVTNPTAVEVVTNPTAVEYASVTRPSPGNVSAFANGPSDDWGGPAASNFTLIEL